MLKGLSTGNVEKNWPKGIERIHEKRMGERMEAGGKREGGPICNTYIYSSFKNNICEE